MGKATSNIQIPYKGQHIVKVFLYMKRNKKVPHFHDFVTCDLSENVVLFVCGVLFRYSYEGR